MQIYSKDILIHSFIFILGVSAPVPIVTSILLSSSGRLSSLQHPDGSEATLAALLFPVSEWDEMYGMGCMYIWDGNGIVSARVCPQSLEGKQHWEESRHATHQDVHEGVSGFHSAGLVPHHKVCAFPLYIPLCTN